MPTFDPNAPVRHDAGIFGLDVAEREAKVVLIPVPWEATTSYGGGTARGPEAILRASHQLDYYDPDVGTPYTAGIHMRSADPRITALAESAKTDARIVIEPEGHAVEKIQSARESVNRASTELNELVRNATHEILSEGKVAGVVGGDHSVAIGSIIAHAESFGPIGVLQLDAHADLRLAYHGFDHSHASALRSVLDRCDRVETLVQLGIRDVCPEEIAFIDASNGRVRTFFDRELQRARIMGRLAQLLERAAHELPSKVYVTFDIDGLDPKLCPNTGTPVPGGLELAEVSFLLEAIVAQGKVIVGFDLNEVAPGPDGDEWDANVGARCLYKLIGYTLASRAEGASRAIARNTNGRITAESPSKTGTTPR